MVRSAALSVCWNQSGKTMLNRVSTLSCHQTSGMAYKVRDGPERR